jgi:hypothetical protein
MVCYLEDGSFSNVSPKDLRPFTLTESPYTDYAKARFSKSFSKDPAIKTAVKYLEDGELPEEFTWLLRAREKRFASGESSEETVEPEAPAPLPKKKAKTSANRETADPQVAPAAEPVSTPVTLNESLTNGQKEPVKVWHIPVNTVPYDNRTHEEI